MTAGHFTRTYEIWRRSIAQDPDTGEILPTFAKLADVDGRAYPRSAENRIAAAQEVGIVTWTFACAGDTDVKHGDQVRFDGRVLAVNAVPVTSRGDRIEAMCTEVQM